MKILFKADKPPMPGGTVKTMYSHYDDVITASK